MVDVESEKRITGFSPGGRSGSGIRLSPVELANCDLINDPALSGYRVEGREKRDDGYGKKRPDVVELSFGGFEYSVLQDGTIRLDTYDSSASEAEIPVEIGGRAVSTFSTALFRDCKKLERVSLSGDSDLFSTDGAAVFSRDGTRLVKLAVCASDYAVPLGCEEIADHAFDSAEELTRVELPSSLVRIGALAFAKSGLREVSIPSSVEAIGARAFYSCRSLAVCEISRGLREIGEGAFSLTAIERIVVPESVEAIGLGAFSLTPAQKHVASGAIEIAPGCAAYRIDGAGGLYAGDTFVELIGDVSAYAVRPGTRAVAPGACCRHARLRSIDIPEGVREIGEGAFRGAHALAEAHLPESLESIGEASFMGTGVSHLRLSRNVRRIGREALLVQGEGMMKTAHRLESVDLDARNPVFYRESGLLCERGGGEAGGDACLLYVGPEVDVAIPDAVNRIAPFALCGVRSIERLVVHGHLHSICTSALSTPQAIPRMRVECQREEGGRQWEDFAVPSLTANYRSQTMLLGTDEAGTVFNYAYYDSWVTHASAVAEFAPAAVARLRSGRYLSGRMREVYTGIVAHRAAQVCRYFAGRGDIESLDFLVGTGALSADAVSAEAERAAESGDAQASACLLELKHRHGAPVGIDFSL